MPITSYGRKRNSSSFAPVNTTSFLFDDDDKPSILKSTTKTSPPDIKTILQVQHTADGFPKLIRRDNNGELVDGSSAALDLALVQPTNGELQVTDRKTAARHRVSLPPSALSSNGTLAPLNSILAQSNDIKAVANNRRSMEVKFTAETKRPALMASPPRAITNGAPKAHSSYSTNDIPTLKSINDESSGGVLVDSPPAQPDNTVNITSTDQNSLVSRATSGPAINNVYHHSQDLSVVAKEKENYDGFNFGQIALQANAAPFGPLQPQDASNGAPFQPPAMPYGPSAYYGGYGVNTLNGNFGNMNLGGGYGAQGQWPNQMSQQPYQQGGYGGFQQYPQGAQAISGAARSAESNASRAAVQQRKAQAEELFNSFGIPDIAGQIYGLCKDQYGCRYLQRKLEERNEQDVEIIFEEVKDHFEELMVDPFGNYLCQRLLEYANDEQRTALVNNAAPAMTKIALNQHGTRALQRMIEFISTDEQIQIVIEAMRYDVVPLIQDLNGNHVIQKCLNHLSPHDAQFIFDAVGANPIAVGTHRHGCCVLQRCVDHATGLQKGAMVDCIIKNAYALVQDPFGNYVAQYILDLGEPCFTEPLCHSFVGNVCYLSKQKFSSNVIEKCIRTCSKETRRMLINEFNTTVLLEKLLRDSFANYVVQTALDFADPETKAVMIENLRPILPAIRNTPYGRRIQGKIQDYDEGGNDFMGPLPGGRANSSASVQTVSPNQPPAHSTASSRSNRMGMVGAPAQWGTNGFGMSSGINGFAGAPDFAAPTPQRNQAYNMLNGNHDYQGFGGTQDFQNHAGAQVYQNHGFGGQAFYNMGRSAPSYGQF